MLWYLGNGWVQKNGDEETISLKYAFREDWKRGSPAPLMSVGVKIPSGGLFIVADLAG